MLRRRTRRTTDGDLHRPPITASCRGSKLVHSAANEGLEADSQRLCIAARQQFGLVLEDCDRQVNNVPQIAGLHDVERYRGNNVASSACRVGTVCTDRPRPNQTLLAVGKWSKP